MDDPGRKLIFENPEAGVRYFWVKPSDVAIYVERGAADLGIVGKDILLEYQPDVYELLDLRMGVCRMAVAGKKDFRDPVGKTLKVATKFPNIARNYYASKCRDIDIIHLNGSIELAPILGLSHVIVDIVETVSYTHPGRPGDSPPEDPSERLPAIPFLRRDRSSGARCRRRPLRRRSGRPARPEAVSYTHLPVEKFFATMDSAVLFPEYIARTVRQGMEENDILPAITATTTVIDAMDYRSIYSNPTDADKELKDVAEGAAIPETQVKTKEHLVSLTKRGRMLVASYEALRFQKLDLFSVMLRQIGAHIQKQQLADAVGVLISGDGNENAAVQYTIGTAPLSGTKGKMCIRDSFQTHGNHQALIAVPQVHAAPLGSLFNVILVNPLEVVARSRVIADCVFAGIHLRFSPFISGCSAAGSTARLYYLKAGKMCIRDRPACRTAPRPDIPQPAGA